MACLGTHFAVPAEVAARLNQGGPLTSADVIHFIEYLESQYDALRTEGCVKSTENAWDSIHRRLTDGKLETGSTPWGWQERLVL